MLRVILLAAAAAGALVACGGESPTSSSGGPSTKGPDAKTKQALLRYAQCMRDHGVDMQDPNFSGGRVTMRAGGPGTNTSPQKQEAAQKACQKYQAQIKPPTLSAAEKADFKKKALANAQCMRDHGITNFPDPSFDENGGAQIKIGKNTGINPQDPKFQAAQNACAKVGGFGGGPSTTSKDEQ